MLSSFISGAKTAGVYVYAALALVTEHSRVSRATVLVEPPLPILHGKLKEFHVTCWWPMIHGQKFWTILPVQALKWLPTGLMLFTLFFSQRLRGGDNIFNVPACQTMTIKIDSLLEKPSYILDRPVYFWVPFL